MLSDVGVLLDGEVDVFEAGAAVLAAPLVPESRTGTGPDAPAGQCIADSLRYVLDVVASAEVLIVDRTVYIRPSQTRDSVVRLACVNREGIAGLQ